jgi:hypothetical protein
VSGGTPPKSMSAPAKLKWLLGRGIPRRLRSSVTRIVNPSRRKHLRGKMDFAAFLAALDRRGAEYVVLREPNGPEHPGEVLLKDEHLPLSDDLVTEWPGGMPIRLFTPSARPGTGYEPPQVNGQRLSPMPLFPVHRAEALIQSGMDAPGNTRLLNPTDAFLARAYRATYLQVEDWAQRSSTDDWVATPSLQRDLERLSNAAAIPLAAKPRPQDLDALLAEHGWRPPVDLLEKVSSWMLWLKDMLPTSGEDLPGVVAVFIRERAVKAGFKDRIINYLTDGGFDPLVCFDLSPEQRRLVETSLRGGNWRIGGFPVDAGPPTTLIIALDLLPIPVPPEVQAEQPLCDNVKIVWAKQAIRDEVNGGKPRKQHYNPVHSTDNSKQAWHVIELLMPDRQQELRDVVERHRRAFESTQAGVDLTRGRRARVELVEHQGTRAIRKTFRPGKERFMAREIAAMSKLSDHCAAVPKLLDFGDDYLVREYVEGAPVEHAWPRPLPLATVRQLADIIRTCVEHGFDPIGLAPTNILVTPSGVRVIDFEFWRECDPKLPPDRSYCLAGLPKNYEGDRPPGDRSLFHPYAKRWVQHTALGVQSFLHDPAWLQRLKRSVHLSRRYAKWAVSSLLRNLRTTVARTARRRMSRRRASSQG